MVDAGQAFNPSEAARRGRVYQQMGCFWYEAPIPACDHVAWAELARDLDMPIATGGNDYTKYVHADLIGRRGVDIVQADSRAVGVSEWMEIAATAAGFGLDVAGHGGGAANLHILLAAPNAVYLESGSLKGEPPAIEALRMRDGCLLAPELPGMGSELRPDFIAKHKVG